MGSGDQPQGISTGQLIPARAAAVCVASSKYSSAVGNITEMGHIAALAKELEGGETTDHGMTRTSQDAMVVEEAKARVNRQLLGQLESRQSLP